METGLMDDSAPQVPQETPSARRRFRLNRTTLIVFCGAGTLFGLTQYLAAALLSWRPYHLRLDVPLSVVVLTGLTVALLIGGAILHFVQQWKLQVWRMKRTLQQTHAGELPIEQFGPKFGGLTPLRPVLQEMMRDYRRLRSEIARLNLEMGQRVAQRTDALERMVGKLNAQATRDVLTGLYNRRMLDQCLEELVQRCTADRAPLCLMMIDVDDFKMLNDTLGHAAGDTLLRAVGQLIRSSIRERDLAFRCGGDEFVVVLPQSSKAEGEALARRLGDLIDALVKPLSVPRRPRLSFGIGTLGDLAMGTVNAAELMKEADRRLYAVKYSRKAAIKKEVGAAALGDRAA
jgi:diguanylate cyclase (GGDEF)-like protein